MNENEKVEEGATTPEATPTEPTDEQEFLAGLEEETTPPSEKKGKKTPPAKEKEEKAEAKGKATEEPVEEPPEEKVEKTTEEWETENEDLKKQLAEKEKELAESKEKPEEEPEEKEFVPEEMPEDVKNFLEDYPEAEPTIEYFMRNEVGRQLSEVFGTKDLAELKESVEQLKAWVDDTHYAINFEAVVLGGYWDDKTGEFVEGHSDAKKIARTEQWEKWITAKTKKDESYAAPESPQRAIQIITEFKTDMAKESAATHDTKLAKEAGKTREAITEPVEGGKTGGTPPKAEDKNSFADGFQEEL